MGEKFYFEDIICAKATPSGSSAVAIIRVSGKDSWRLLSKIFKSMNKNFSSFKTHRAYYGDIVDDQEVVDNALVITFKEKSSFTGEESFEINCHGSEIIASLILKILIKNGARLADPGEFSKRGFLNGKMNLAEAESIMDIVSSSTKQSALIAVRQLSGRLTSQINEIKNKIADLLADVEVYIDYPEEDLKIDEEKWKNEISLIKDLTENLLAGFERGKFYRKGVEAVILGKTNAGKSTMFNYLLDFDKAIVSDIHGTTRDYIDAIINVAGYGVRIYDTAGLRETNDPIEYEGARRARELAKNSDIVLYLIGYDYGLTEEDKNNLKSIEKNKKVIIVINKIELSNDEGEKLYSDIDFFLKSLIDNYRIIKMSGLNKFGVEDFNEAFLSLLINEKSREQNDPIITNERHKDLLDKTKINLINALKELDNELLDITAFELREALDNLGEITGEITPSDILNKIFSTFCIGK
ncbi:MAG TPA: tRNA uridine-5-carboxymethylaminomethyl(34) synthesis GTPase MnmE [Spirochaetota bacterium]|nr:tRNA uridine-5-carboxymethylaminomethyl(34) synthesis GTPase MnmE [Spirochaetota bacterium]